MVVRKIKNIITAIGNPILNCELKKLEKFNVLNNDILYQEGILEILDSNDKIDFLILSQLLPGQFCLENLIEELGGIDVYFHSSGIGSQNTLIDINVEISTCKTNVLGFTRMVDYMYNYFKTNNISGQICVISSIAGTKGLGVSPAYSATKRFQNTYIECLEQLSHMQKLNISFTDIRPGFVKTALLNDGNNYPMLMDVKYAAKKIVSAVERKKRIAIVDWKYAILLAFFPCFTLFGFGILPPFYEKSYTVYICKKYNNKGGAILILLDLWR